MNNKKHYPLHPGQTHVEPMYTQVPTEDYEALKREVQQLREITKGSRTTVDDIAEIRTLSSEVIALREMNAKAQEEIAELREATRWRKCSEELPEEERQFLCLRQTGDINILWWSKQLKSFAQYDITHWMPRPKAPEEK